MKISVLVTTYNGSKYILDQLDSIKCQTRKPDEVIIIDDCSTDNTYEIVDNYIKANSLNNTWTLLSNNNNVGWKQNFHDGLKRITGDIVFFCDQDDIWFINKIEIVSKVFSSETKVVGSDKIYFTDNDEKMVGLISNISMKKIDLFNTKHPLVIGCGGSTMALSMDFYYKVKNYYSPTMAHDDFFWKAAVVNETLEIIEEPTIYRRLHGDNASTGKRTLEKTIEMIEQSNEVVMGIKEYIHNNKTTLALYEEKMSYISNYINVNNTRKCFVQKFSWRTLIKLFSKKNYIYAGYRNLIGDIIFSVFPRWRK